MTTDRRKTTSAATRLTLLCRAANAANRQSLFGGDLPLPMRETERLTTFAKGFRRFDRVLHAPEQAARDTAAAFQPASMACPDLRDVDYGEWTGKSFAEIAEADPDGMRLWMTDPSAAPHGGESFEAARTRAASWLNGLHGQAGHGLAVTHAILLKLLLAHVLGAPTNAVWQIDAAPLSTLFLTSDGRRWALRGFANAP